MIAQPMFLDKTASLTPWAQRVVCAGATEAPHSGRYSAETLNGTYLCRRCGLALFRADSQFDSGCGWPSFDVNVDGAVKERPDSDGRRIEIRCQRCDAHLGHVFDGEGFTENNRRFCVNSVALDFVKNAAVMDTEEAILAGGCFWGVAYYLGLVPGVLSVEAGYTGGQTLEPSYEDVCTDTTGHYEAVRVLYDVRLTTYSAVLKRFFEIHDPTQANGQGPDLGFQYRSAVFCYNEDQQREVRRQLALLTLKHYTVVTEVLQAQIFWPAEGYHQDYYLRHKKQPYCHRPVLRFD
ncbi:MAG: bifunctional methionine sulfoxide reductase B/A protein [Legionellaceae bacterium]